MNVAVIGCGVRGCVVAALLAGGGVEELALVDGGLIAESDLGASPLVFTPDVNFGKADALVAKLALIAPETMALPFPADLNADNAEAIITGASLVVDCVGTAEVAEALEHAARETGLEVISPPGDYSPSVASPAEAVATGAVQASEVLSRRP